MSIGYGPKVVTDGLVLALDAADISSYPGSGTTWSDLSGNGNNGTLVNGVGYDSGNLGSLTFDGVNDYVSLTTTYSPLLAPWTLSFWAYPIFTDTHTINQVFYSASTSTTTYSLYASSNSLINNIDLDASGNLYISSSYTNGTISRVFKFDSSYQIDSSFNTGEAFDFARAAPPGWSTVVSSYYPGKIYTGYNFNLGNQLKRSGLQRLNSDGSIDTTFNPSGDGFNSVTYEFVEDSNGKLYVGGAFTSYNGTTANRIIRLNTDGSIDTGFNTGTGFNNAVYKIIEDSNGKLYVGGLFTSYNGTTANRIIRLNTDGSIDTGFNTGTGVNAAIFALTLDSNGKLYVGGNFTSYNGTTANRIIRLNTDGSRDTGFNSDGSGFDSASVRCILEDSNGRLICSGNFSSYKGSSVGSLVVLNSDGSLYLDVITSNNLLVTQVLESFFSDVNTYSTLDIKKAGIANSVRLTSTEFSSIFDGTTPVNVVETMSDTGLYRYYLNGVLMTEAQATTNTTVNVESLMQGRFSTYWFNGKVSNIGVYNKELTSQEIQQNFNALRGRFNI